MYLTKRIDEANARRIAPNEHGRARHQVHLDPLPPNNPVIPLCGFLDQTLKILEPKLRIRERMGKIEDRTIRILSMHPA